MQNGNFTKLDSTKRRKHLGILSNNFCACNKKFVSLSPPPQIAIFFLEKGVIGKERQTN